MSSFFDKLKKGMGVEESSGIKENSELEKDLSSLLPKKESRLQRVKKENLLAGGEKQEKTKKSLPLKPRRAKKEKKGKENKKVKNEKVEQKEMRKVEIKEESASFENYGQTKSSPASEAGTDKEEKFEKKWLEPEGELTVDVYQTDEDIVIQSAIAGITPEDIDISIENDMITLRGERKRPTEKEKGNYFFQECYWGPFSREIVLPEEVDNSRTQASLKNGVLTIRIPKIERSKKRKIVIE